MRKTLLWLCIIGLLISGLSVSTAAKSISYTPYEGYEYNIYGESVAAPAAYIPEQVLYSADLGLETELSAPTDMLYFQDALFVLDSGNGRILEWDAQWKLVHIYDTFQTDTGESKSIVGAKGFTLNRDGSRFYIANTEFLEVLCIERDSGRVLQTITRPDEVLPDTEAHFSATKVIVDKKGLLYVLVDTISNGAFVYNEAGEFQTFFGANPVVATGTVIRDYFWKRFMTKEQRKGLVQVTPTVFSNFDLDEYGFLYTVTSSPDTTAVAGTVRRLNYSGDDILKDGLKFGDLEWDRGYDQAMYTDFSDIDIDENGYITLLDTGRGKVFQYTSDGEQIAVFGSYSNQSGGFVSPTAIETIGDRVLVLDAKKKALICFAPTEYGATLREAFSMLNSTHTDEARALWERLLELNTNSRYPYYGLGMVYDHSGEYAKAMEMFRLAGATKEYSKALQEYRREWIDSHYLVLLLGAALLVGLAVSVVRFLKKKAKIVEGTAFSALETRGLFPLYTALHPVDGFEQFRTRRIYSLPLVLCLVLSWFFLYTFDYFCAGYCFNSSRPEDYQFLVAFVLTVGLYVLFVVSNWAVCVLLNGKGAFAEIASTVAYSLLPHLICQLICTGLSNVLTAEEGIFITLVSYIGWIWTGICLFMGLQTIHHYSFGQNIGSILLTVCGMIIIFLVLVLFYTLLQQAFSFVRSVMAELSLR